MASQQETRAPSRLRYRFGAVGQSVAIARLRGYAQWRSWRLDRSLRKRLDHKAAVSTKQRLLDTPVSALRAGLTAESEQMLAALGIKTAAEILKRSSEDLQKVKGIKEGKANTLVENAKKLRDLQRDDLTLPADPDTWNGAEIALAEALILRKKFSDFIETVLKPILAEASNSAKQQRRASSRKNWRGLSPVERQHLLNQSALAWRELEGLQSQAVDELPRRIRDLLHHQRVPADEIRSSWRRDGAKHFTHLERYLLNRGTSEEKELIGRFTVSGLSTQLVQRMKSLALDLSTVKRELRIYQEEGVRFIVASEGCILGDEMGLGKTTQALGAMAHLSRTERNHHHLVICPAQLIRNWSLEAREVLPTIPTHVFHGPRRAPILEAWERDGGILITSFDLLGDAMESANIPVNLLVVDEAHYAKRPSSRRSKITFIAAQRAQRVALLTGTPLENSDQDLVRLLRLANAQAATQLQRILGSGRSNTGSDVRRFLTDYYLRRKQTLVAPELPPITYSDLAVQVEYREIPDYLEAVRSGAFTRMRIAATLHGSKPIAKHPTLKDVVSEARASNKKVLLFSEFIEVLKAVGELIGNDAWVVYSKTPNRDEVIRQFRESPGFAALIGQIGIIGTGHNFPEATIVIVVEPQCKPTIEWQAIKRAHRLTSTQPVFAYRMVTEGTVEEHLVALTGFKARLFEELVDESDLARKLQRLDIDGQTQQYVIESERNRHLGNNGTSD